VLGIALSKFCYTQTNCIIASDILAVRGLVGWCQNLHTAAVRAGYSQCGMWGGTRASICLLPKRLRPLAPANSSHLRSLWSVTVQTVGAGIGCKQVSHLQTAQSSEGYLLVQHNVARTAVQPLYPAAEAPLCSKLNHNVQQTVRGRLT
jgi:hypothetical protein